MQLHLSTDNFQGELLLREDEQKDPLFYSQVRMVPPGEVYFFYSVNGERYVNDVEYPILEEEVGKEEEVKGEGEKV